MRDLLGISLGFDEPAPVYPEWVRRCAANVHRSQFRGLIEKLKSGVSLAQQAGLAFGLVQAGQKLVESTLGHLSGEALKQLREVTHGREAAASIEFKGDTLIPREVEEMAAQLQAQFGLQQVAGFHEGVAYAHRLLGNQANASPATRIQLVLLLYWPWIEMLESMEQLCALLDLALGRDVVGDDPKRIRQICQRIGLRFRPPGRPRKIPHKPRGP